ncbi:MAG: nucleotide-binding protein [Patescibacteria group bacterium]|nr:nucleotide-binding protein [Patescibacteria group bacterium]
MAKRQQKYLAPDEPTTLLVASKVAREKIFSQIGKGNTLLEKNFSSAMEPQGLIKDYNKWNDYNKELLGILFTGKNVVNDYERHTHVTYSFMRDASEEFEDYKKLIKGAIDELESLDERLDLIPENQFMRDLEPSVSSPIFNNNNNNVFIVHGHNDGLKQTVARLIEKLALNPIVLHEQANGGMTVIEKFEKNANVGFAVVLLTGDDIGGAKDHAQEKFNKRARQNVIFELGYFVGRLGRNRVCALYESEVELPSDINGVLYIKYDSSESWKYQLCKELKSSGFSADMNQI